MDDSRFPSAPGRANSIIANFNPLRFSLPLERVSDEERRNMIARAAYFRAERRNFAPGHEEEDWVAAEAEVDRELARRGLR
jgi:hypothetical protein